MYAAADPLLLLNAWHALANDRYDFASGLERLEVKTTTGQRRHKFSLEQLEPPTPATVTVASVITESSSAGLTIRDMITAVAHRCGGDSASRLVKGAVEALGSEISEWSAQRYDATKAAQSLRLLDGRGIPRPSVASSAVFDVRFSVELSDAAPIPATDLGVLASAIAT